MDRGGIGRITMGVGRFAARQVGKGTTRWVSGISTAGVRAFCIMFPHLVDGQRDRLVVSVKPDLRGSDLDAHSGVGGIGR